MNKTKIVIGLLVSAEYEVEIKKDADGELWVPTALGPIRVQQNALFGPGLMATAAQKESAGDLVILEVLRNVCDKFASKFKEEKGGELMESDVKTPLASA